MTGDSSVGRASSGAAHHALDPGCIDFVRLETEEERRQAEPTIAISGFGWQHYAKNPHKIAQLWGVAAYFGPPEPNVPLLTWARDRFSVIHSASEFAWAEECSPERHIADAPPS